VRYSIPFLHCVPVRDQVKAMQLSHAYTSCSHDSGFNANRYHDISTPSDSSPSYIRGQRPERFGFACGPRSPRVEVTRCDRRAQRVSHAVAYLQSCLIYCPRPTFWPRKVVSYPIDALCKSASRHQSVLTADPDNEARGLAQVSRHKSDAGCTVLRQLALRTRLSTLCES
jgi:hypothetical protein